jgi:spore maturation protein CgeB
VRILFTNNAPIIRGGMAWGAEKLGCEVRVLDTWTRSDKVRFLVEHLRDFRPDAVFTEGYPFPPDPVEQALRIRPTPHIYWATEDPVYVGLSQSWAKISRFVFTLDAARIPDYRAMGKPAEVMLHACNPEVHRPLPASERYRHDIVLVAYNSAERQHLARMMLGPLIAGGYDVFVWGGLWQDPARTFRVPEARCGGLLPWEEIPAAYASASIVLGIHHVVDSPTQTSMRTFEALGCRAFYLTHHTRSHENLFRNGEHLVWVRTADELIKAVNHYLRSPEERARVAEAGQRQAYAQHTYVHRAAQLIRAVRSLV